MGWYIVATSSTSAAVRLRFPPEVITVAVRWYPAFRLSCWDLSCWDVAKLLANSLPPLRG